ncbi:MAG: hypothetical protein MHM6MM_003067 [Cercozoa sp. M6MM]
MWLRFESECESLCVPRCPALHFDADACCSQVSDEVALCAYVDDSTGELSNEMRVEARVSEDIQGYFSFGFGQGMVNADAVISNVHFDGTVPESTEIEITGKSGAAITPREPSHALFERTDYSVEEGEVRMQYTRPLRVPDDHPAFGDDTRYSVEVMPAETPLATLPVVMAQHPTSRFGSGSFTRHTRRFVLELPLHRASACDLGTTPISPPASTSWPGLLTAHVTLMLLAWLLFAPLAVWCGARKRLASQEKAVQRYFELHRVFATLTAIATLAGFACIVSHVQGAHFSHGHGIAGLIVVLLTVCQVLLGALRPSPQSESRTKWRLAHLCTGTTVLTVAYGAVVFGVLYLISIYGQSDTTTSFFVLTGASLLLLLLGTTIDHMRNGKKQDNADDSAESRLLADDTRDHIFINSA